MMDCMMVFIPTVCTTCCLLRRSPFPNKSIGSRFSLRSGKLRGIYDALDHGQYKNVLKPSPAADSSLFQLGWAFGQVYLLKKLGT